MTGLTERASLWRFFAPFAIFVLVATACTQTAAPTGSEAADESDAATESEAPDATDGGEAPQGGELDTYTLGMFQDMTTDNAWNYYDVLGGTVYNQYVLAPTLGALYTITMPGIELMPSLAAGDLEPAVQEGDVWVAEVALREDLMWSDGEPLTAEDFAFTWNTAVDFQLTDSWQDVTDAVVTDEETGETSGIVASVEAADDMTVRITFAEQPGLAVWGPGTSVNFMPVQPQHFWQPIVDEAAASDDPRLTLLSASGADAPSIGATEFDQRQEGSFAATTANPNYPDMGLEFTSGGVTWTEGPYAQNFQFPIYGGQEAAVLALADGEVDFLLNPLGMQRGFQAQVQENEDLTAIVNPTNGYRFMAFNHSRAPMDDPAFRNALTAMINKEFVTDSLLQGVAFPLYVILPEGNTQWYNEEVATELEEIGYAGLDDDTRRQTAIQILTDAGYTWESAPGWDDPATEDVEEREPTFTEGWTWLPGDGLIGLDGQPVPTLELVHPTASYDPLRATFGGYIAGVAQEIGIPLVSVPTDFNKIVADVFATDPDDPTLYTSPFDIFILGYSLGNAAFPTFHGAFFMTGGSSNNTQYSSTAYDEFSAAFDSAQTQEEAYEAMWEMERLIAADKPHVPLFDTGILEFYNNRVQYPFTETLSGLQFLFGLQSSVTSAE